jgi:hypothetical protein
MSLRLEIELQEEDLERFRTMFNQARRVVESMEEKEILDATRKLVEEAASRHPPGFIQERMLHSRLRDRRMSSTGGGWRITLFG